jgi:uncharacterized membrane protein YeiH
LNLFIYWLDLLGVAVFAASGALVASRKQLDLVGFGLIATVTGIGGGTLRDLLLDRPPGWVQAPEYLLLCLGVASLLFFIAPHIQRRYPVLLWADAAGLSLFSVLGAQVAANAGTAPLVAVVMGVMTATFGGLIRDVLCNEIPLILRKEIYASAAALGAVVYLLVHHFAPPPGVAALAGFAACFSLRALALMFGWSLPAYKSRPGRDYPVGDTDKPD